MEQIKISDAELKLMEFVWEHGALKATELVELAKHNLNWSRTTTYTQIKRLMEKGAIEKVEPNFICKPLVSKECVQLTETNNLINKLYNGSRQMFLSAFLSQEKLSDEELDEIKKLIEQNKS